MRKEERGDEVLDEDRIIRVVCGIVPLVIIVMLTASIIILKCRGGFLPESTNLRIVGYPTKRCYRNFYAEYTFGSALGVASANERFLREDLFFESGIIAMFRLCEEDIVGLSEEEAVRIAKERHWDTKVVEMGYIYDNSACPLVLRVAAEAKFFVGTRQTIYFETEKGIVVRVGTIGCSNYP